MKPSRFNSVIQLFVLCAGGNAIFYVVFMRSSYYNVFIEAFGVSNEQFGMMISAYAWTATIGYFFGGILADRVSCKKLLTFSFFSTGILNIILGTFPGYKMAMVVFILLGITTTLTFWAAMIKATRMIGKTIGSESRAYGIREAGASFFEIIVGTFSAWIFGFFPIHKEGLQVIIFLYGGILIVLAVVTMLFFNDDVKSNQKKKAKRGTCQIACLKNKSIWLIALAALGGYTIGSIIGAYCGSIAYEKFHFSLEKIAFIGMMTAYFKPIGALLSGFLGDRFKSLHFMLVLIFLLTICALIIGYIPENQHYIGLFFSVFIIEIILTGAVRGQLYTPMSEVGIPMDESGTAIGIISTVAYASDAFLPPVIGKLLDCCHPVVAYQYTMLILACFGVLAMISLIILIINQKNRYKQSEG